MNKFKKGFTLIELMVVVLIVGLLSGLIVVNVNNSRISARDARRIADLDTIRTAIEMYASVNKGKYPTVAGAVYSIPTSTQWISTDPPLVPNYIPVLPADPINGTVNTIEYKYGYITNADGTNYKLVAYRMESSEGKAKANNAKDGGNSTDEYELFSSGGQSLSL